MNEERKRKIGEHNPRFDKSITIRINNDDYEKFKQVADFMNLKYQRLIKILMNDYTDNRNHELEQRNKYKR